MRLALTLTIIFGFATPPCLAAPEIRLINDAGLPAAAMDQIRKDYPAWAARVYRYHHLARPLPVNLVITRQVQIGYYTRPNIYLPQDDDPRAMLETFVHELAHHATGHESSFFFKEGIATATAEALFAEQGEPVNEWPQYGISTSAWVRLFLQRNELPPLSSLVAQSRYDNSSRDTEFRSWQAYLIAGNFLSWLIQNEGYDTFREVFWEETLGAKATEWEQLWLASIRTQKPPSLDLQRVLPQTARYRYYARRLSP